MARTNKWNTKAVTITIPGALYDNLKSYAQINTGDILSRAASILLERQLGKKEADGMMFSAAVKQLENLISVLEKKLSGQGIAKDEIYSIRLLYELKPRIDEVYLEVGEVQKHVSEIERYVQLEMPPFLRATDEAE